MTLHDIPITMLDERESSLGEFQGRALLVVNVASKCGLTPQYAGLEQLQEEYADRGLHRPRRALQPVRGAGAGHRRGDRGVLLGDVRRDLPADREGRRQRAPAAHPLYERLVGVADAEGYTGDVRWNFEKFLVAPSGKVVARFRPQTEPDAPRSSPPSRLPSPDDPPPGSVPVRNPRTCSKRCESARDVTFRAGTRCPAGREYVGDVERVLVVGGGYVGMYAALRLQQASSARVRPRSPSSTPTRT